MGFGRSVFLVAVYLSCACGGPSDSGEPAERSLSDLAARDTSNILFIGNSLTGTQTHATGEDMPAILSRLAASRGKSLRLKRALFPGHTLQQIWSSNVPQPLLTGSTRWDFIVLQEQSTLPVRDPAAFSATILSSYQPKVRGALKAQSGALVLFENWALVDHRPFSTRTDYVAALQRIYARVEHQLHVPTVVAPVGRAFEMVLSTKPYSYLYKPDGKHPGDAAIYLNACVFHAVLFRESPIGLPRLYLSATDAAFLQHIAAEVALAAPRPKLPASTLE
jgi:hypothetical protein